MALAISHSLSTNSWFILNRIDRCVSEPEESQSQRERRSEAIVTSVLFLNNCLFHSHRCVCAKSIWQLIDNHKINYKTHNNAKLNVIWERMDDHYVIKTTPSTIDRSSSSSSSRSNEANTCSMHNFTWWWTIFSPSTVRSFHLWHSAHQPKENQLYLHLWQSVQEPQSQKKKRLCVDGICETEQSETKWNELNTKWSFVAFVRLANTIIRVCVCVCCCCLPSPTSSSSSFYFPFCGICCCAV